LGGVSGPAEPELPSPPSRRLASSSRPSAF
jgi:hypothetical protein